MQDFLAHYGVEGMHWGERRYQYKNGSLTPQGRLHYGCKDSPRHSGKSSHTPREKSKITFRQKQTLRKVERLDALRNRFDDQKTYDSLVARYGEKGLERIIKNVDKGDAYVRAIRKEHVREEFADAAKTVSNFGTLVASLIPSIPIRATVQGGISITNVLLNQNRNQIKLTEDDAFNIAEMLADDRVTLSDTLLDKIVDSDIFNTIGYVTKSAEDFAKINKKREIKPFN